MGGQSKRRGRRAVVAAVMLVASLAAHAGSDTGAMTVSATVLGRSGCLFSSGSFPTLDFGVIDQLSTANATAATTVTVRCRGNILSAWNITVDDGKNPTGPNARRLVHQSIATELLPYGLNVAPLSGWMLFTGTRTVNITGTITPANFQPVAAGEYADTVTLTLTF